MTFYFDFTKIGLSHFNFHLDWIVVMTASHMHFYEHLSEAQYMYQSENV